MNAKLHSLSLWALGVISLLSVVVDTILLALVAIISTINRININGIAFAASGLQLVSLIILAGMFWRRISSWSSVTHASQVSWLKRNADVFLSFIVAVIAGSITLASILWMRIILEDLPALILGQQPSRFLLGMVITFVISIVFQLATFAFILFTKESFQVNSELPDQLGPEVSMSRPGTSRSIHSNPFTRTSSPPLSPSLTSLRSSITLPTRSVSSKTRLVNSRPTSKSADTAPFDWDTSTVPTALREAVHTLSRNVQSTLPPIPGSRPASPAKALDGPFLPPSPHPPQSQPSSPDQGVFQHIFSPSLPVSTESLPLSLPKPPFHSSTPDRSRAGSLASRTPSNDSLRYQNAPKRAVSTTSLAGSVSHLRTVPSFDEENIHPLFRPSSSTPPPVISIRTNIHGATIEDAEEVVSPGGRRRAESRVGSPLARGAEWFPGDGTNESVLPNQSPVSPMSPATESIWRMDAPTVNAHPAMPGDERKEGKDGVSEKSDGENPIPDFVLAAGQRGSFLGFERRRKSDTGG